MTYPISPGVYPREIDQSYIVGAVANSIGGIVINANKGTTGALELITSNKEFIDMYGEPILDNPSMYSALAFLENGKRLLVARAINDAVSASQTGNVDCYLWAVIGQADSLFLIDQDDEAIGLLERISEYIDESPQHQHPLESLHIRLSLLCLRQKSDGSAISELNAAVEEYEQLGVRWPREYVAKIADGDFSHPKRF